MDNTLPLPPMSYNLWGTPDEAKPLSDSIKKLIRTLFNVSDRPIQTTAPSLSPVRLTTEELSGLAEIVGKQYLSTDNEQRRRRARGKSYPDLLEVRLSETIDAPDAVVAPATEEELFAVLRFCSEHSIAVVTFGGGTSVVGGITPKRGGHHAVISVDVVRFNQLEDVDHVSGLATLGAGLTGPHAELLLKEHGLQVGHFPQSFPYATIGGYAATRSSGQNSAGYGRFDEMVQRLTVVTPVGIMEVGCQAPASAAGPDLRQLFLGSEGVFGIITKVRVRVHKLPATKRYEAFSFPDFATATTAVREVVQQKTGPTVIRLSDEIESAINLSSTDDIGKSDNPSVGCVCLTMYEGSAEASTAAHTATRTLLLSLGATSLGEQPVRSWEKGRFGAPFLRDGLIDNGVICETLETATDWSNIPAVKKAVTTALGASLAETGTTPLIMCHISHVYDAGASLYFTVVAGQTNNPARQWWQAKEAACKAIVAAGGTISHHHAVGTDHRPYLESEIGQLGVKILAAVKNTLDPAGIMNPQKLVL